MSLVNEVRNKIFEALEQEVNYKSYAIFRSCLAFCTFLTFIFNDTDVIFPKFKIDKFYNTINTFGLFWGNVVIQNILLYKVICIFILLLVIIGFMPRITGILHFLVCFSFFRVCPFVDGGDQICSNLTLILIPLTLFDNNINHWKPSNKNFEGLFSKPIFINITFLIYLQISIIYLHSSLGKLAVPEWRDGTALYYWSTHEIFGANYFR